MLQFPLPAPAPAGERAYRVRTGAPGKPGFGLLEKASGEIKSAPRKAR